MILVADAHISADKQNTARFRDFLGAVSATEHDVLFLGDIFDLWVGFPRYEDEAHHDFLAWCRRESRQRTVAYLEGNHEYFVAAAHGDAFSLSAVASLSLPGGILAVHGDAINRADRRHLCFRLITKSPAAYWLLRCMPWGPAFANWVRRRFRHRKSPQSAALPENLLCAYAAEQVSQGVRTVFLGHYHAPFVHRARGGQALYVIPAWCDDEQIGLCNNDGTDVRVGPWTSLL